MTSPAETTAGAIVFSDIVGFTELTDLHGDDVAITLVERQVATVRELLPADARIVKELGDGLLIWFDDGHEALSTAVRLQRTFTSAADAMAADTMAANDATDPAYATEVPMWVRIGAHWGAPRRRGADIIGRDVNLASRLAGLAAPGEVLCTEQLVDELRRRTAPAPCEEFAFESLGATFVKGFADPVPVFRAKDRSCASAE
jgi:adenylate cyclase